MLEPKITDRLRDSINNNVIMSIGLFVVTFIFRYCYMNAGLFHFDEVSTAIAVEDSIKHLRLAGEVSGRYGTVLLNVFFFLPYQFIGGTSAEPTLLLISALAGALFIPVFFLFALEITENRLTSLASTLFLACNFLFLTASTTGKEQTPQLLFIMLSLFLLARGIRQDRTPIKLIGALAYSISLTIHEGGIPLLPIMLAFIVSLNINRGKNWPRIAKDVFLFLAITAIPFLIYLGDIIRSNLASHGENAASFIGLFSPVFHNAVSDIVILSGPLLFLAAAGLLLLAKRIHLFIPVIMWLGLFFYFGNIYTYTARYLMYLLPPLALIAGMATDYFLGRLVIRANTRLLLAGLAVVIVGGYGLFKAWPLISFRHNYCGPKEAALFVRDHTEPDAIVLAADESIHIRYYARRATLSHPVDELNGIKDFVTKVGRLVQAGKKVYVTTSAYNYDRDGYFQILMADRFALVQIGEVIDEDFHRPELVFQKYRSRLYRVLPAGTAPTAVPAPAPPNPEDL